ncbi:hypothetical protein GQ457_04G018450 [Hibiscus cannabinus]
MFFDVLSPISNPVLPNSDLKTSESDLEPEPVLLAVETDRLLSPSHPYLLSLVSRFGPDQAGNPLRPKAFPWVGSGA